MSDILVIGGGIAGLSAASALAKHARVTILEGEDALGYHSSGRSVSFSHYGIGNAAVRGLTAWSRTFYEHQPDGLCDTAIARTAPSLYVARKAQLPALEALRAEMDRFTDAMRWLDEGEILDLCPVLRTGPSGAVRAILDPTSLKLDADALLQAHARALRRAGGSILTGRRIASIEHRAGRWQVTSESGESWSAPILINAAGAWGDHLAALAGVRPIGLAPKRRTIIVVDPPPELDVSAWPFVHTAASDFYMLPEAGRLLISPVDEVEDGPGDAQPEDYDVALAAHQLEQYTSLAAGRIAHRWAGLRSFVADRVPTAGFDDAAPGFFWLVGQGGYGLQTAPAMAAIVEALITGGRWPEGLGSFGIAPSVVTPGRLRGGTTTAEAS
ncbi:FAD-binding oxidoreductase [Sphingosinicella sp. BN140058]|uniref:NAD(P)/FAD-dependent oxidoreductase n=1 Tax=Sphingosinicella sp. BN140058 TaxID=1892855 RepID=UPI0010112563|nr:FAD-binding oxidoreductase [Sphingosinicella sp. BN140058]QAY75357.1 FAD-binding oxidoreductase [Sphingosinicella sp. BN140058]